MNELNLITQNNKVLVSSREVAGHFEKEHRKVVRAIENRIENLTGQNCPVENLFIATSFNHSGNEYKEYLLTRDGFSFIVMGFTGAKADIWKMKYIEAFNKMEEAIKNPYENLSTELKAIIMQDKKLQVVEQRIGKLENTMTIDYGQQLELKDLGSRIVVSKLGGKDTPAYKKVGKKAFEEIWRYFKRVMQVNSYRNTPVAELDRAKEVLENWEPTEDLELMIRGANAYKGTNK